ncbi:hypothetical protein WA538_004284 [Blastocystis sp. DL]
MKETENEKKLRIAVGKYTRLTKDVESYILEARDEEKKVKEMKEQKKDEYDIKQMERVLLQTKQMIPRVKSDRQKAFDELSDLIDLLEEDEMIKQSEMFAKAKELITSFSE